MTRQVYFIRPVGMEGPVKIGCSYEPQSRMKALQAWSPYPLEIAAAVPGDMKLERKLHRRFAQHRSHNEWYRGHPDISAVIDTAKAGGLGCDPDSLPPKRQTMEARTPFAAWLKSNGTNAKRFAQSGAVKISVSQAHRIAAGTHRPSLPLAAELEALTGIPARDFVRPDGRSVRRMNTPEARLQSTVRQFLNVALPADIWWTASLAGVRLSIREAVKAKAAGVKPGWPDLQFLCPDGVTRYVEIKAGSGLSPEQRAFRDYAQPLGIWAMARSVDDVAAALTGWGVELRGTL